MVDIISRGRGGYGLSGRTTKKRFFLRLLLLSPNFVVFVDCHLFYLKSVTLIWLKYKDIRKYVYIIKN